MLRSAFSLLSTRITLSVAALVAVALCSSRLFGSIGLESALVLGLLLPPLAAFTAVRTAHESATQDRPALDAFGGAFSVSAALVLIPWVILLLNLARSRACNLGQGVLFHVLGVGVGVVASTIIAVTIAQVVRRRRLACVIAVAVPFFDVLLRLYSFWYTPGIFSYGHFFGYFPGTLYDRRLHIDGAYITFRLSTAVLLCSVVFLGAALRRARSGEARHGTAILAVGGAALVGVLALARAYAPELGHVSDSRYMAARLGREARGSRCTVYAPKELPRAEAFRHAQDCDFRVMRAERLLGVRQTARVTAFFFRNAEEKRSLMGASDTLIAKPWRNEVYLQLEAWPHPVLAHEIAHVVAGNAARGPFRVAGRFAGLVPDPAIIEGTAVAIAWEGRAGLTPDEWSKAMRLIGKAPPLANTLGLTFLEQPADRAYTIAGSFMRFVLKRFGAAAVRRLYASGDYATVTGSREALVHEWERYVDNVALPANAVALAHARFVQQSIFTEACPHVLADLRDAIRSDVAVGDDRSAASNCERLLSIEPNDVATQATWVESLARRGRLREAWNEFSRLKSVRHVPVPLLARAEEALGDALFRTGAFGEASHIYGRLLRMTAPEETRRRLQVKSIGIASKGPIRRAVFELLVRSASPVPPALGVQLGHEIDAARPDGLGPYLVARQLIQGQAYGHATLALNDALSRGLPSDELESEASRLLGMSLYGAGDVNRAREVWDTIRQSRASSAASREEAREWLDRCDLAQEIR